MEPTSKSIYNFLPGINQSAGGDGCIGFLRRL